LLINRIPNHRFIAPPDSSVTLPHLDRYRVHPVWKNIIYEGSPKARMREQSNRRPKKVGMDADF
jgi:hypothetical protein